MWALPEGNLVPILNKVHLPGQHNFLSGALFV